MNEHSEISQQRAATSRIDSVDFDALGFGQDFSDHMFMMRYHDGGWRDPQILPYQAIALQPGALALHYGQTVFEGLKAFRGGDGRVRIFRPWKNFERMRRSCERLCIPEIEEPLFLEALRQLVRIDEAWIPHRRGESLYIRPLIIATEETLMVRAANEYLFLIMTGPVREYFDKAAGTVSLKAEEKYTRAAPGGTGFAKTAGNYAATLRPGLESQQQGFDQILWLDGREHRQVEEVGQMNMFFRIDGRVVTPPLRGTILPGVTRDSVLTLLREQGIECEERIITIDEVVEAIEAGAMDEAFGAGTAAVIAPVGRIAYRDKVLDINDRLPGPLASQLYQDILAIQHGEVADRFDWCMEVPVTVEANEVPAREEAG